MMIEWPDNKRFAFTIFDDTDCETLENTEPVYSFLADCGFRTSKSIWVVRGDPQKGFNMGQTCEDADYLQWLLKLQADGFEIGWHNSTWHGLPREQVSAALDRFAKLFGHPPVSAANHSPDERVYWNAARLSGVRKLIYGVLTQFRHRDQHAGHIKGDDYFWGDLCKEQIKYYRNFVYRDINTLKACPVMPYHDTARPYVNYWFASSDGHDVAAFDDCLSERNQDRLEAEGGACIMYTHFAKGFFVDGRLNPRFTELMRRLSQKKGWFPTTTALLDRLLAVNGHHDITDAERRRLEYKWLWEKTLIGSN
jgi:hypothetical protein